MSKTQIRENIHIFSCPLCGGKMHIKNDKSIVCTKNHCFDLSKRGYVNLLMSRVKTEYDRDMLKSRNLIVKSGLFRPMTQTLSSLILENAPKAAAGGIRILDTGCGEGSHLAQIIDNISGSTDMKIIGVGIDISREGIQIASRDYPGIAWCVADLTGIPFTDGSFNGVLNILSPANYSEFRRLLTDDGVLVKVVPGSGYLAELREFFYRSTEKEEYSNKRVIEHFQKNFNITGTHRILYNMPVDKENLKHLIRMTPLSWGAADERIKEALKTGIPGITVDLTVILGKRQT